MHKILLPLTALCLSTQLGAATTIQPIDSTLKNMAKATYTEKNNERTYSALTIDGYSFTGKKGGDDSKKKHTIEFDDGTQALDENQKPIQVTPDKNLDPELLKLKKYIHTVIEQAKKTGKASIVGKNDTIKKFFEENLDPFINAYLDILYKQGNGHYLLKNGNPHLRDAEGVTHYYVTDIYPDSDRIGELIAAMKGIVKVVKADYWANRQQRYAAQLLLSYAQQIKDSSSPQPSKTKKRVKPQQ